MWHYTHRYNKYLYRCNIFSLYENVRSMQSQLRFSIHFYILVSVFDLDQINSNKFILIDSNFKNYNTVTINIYIRGTERILESNLVCYFCCKFFEKSNTCSEVFSKITFMNFLLNQDKKLQSCLFDVMNC